MAVNEFDVLDFSAALFILTIVGVLLFIFYVLQPAVVYGIVASLYSFVQLKHAPQPPQPSLSVSSNNNSATTNADDNGGARLYVWGHELSVAPADSPLLVRQPLCSCRSRFGAARTRLSQPEVDDGAADAYETFPCCWLPVNCCPTTQGMLRYLLWTGVFLVLTLFWTNCILESRFWSGFGCPDPAIASGASAAFDPVDSAQSVAPFTCYSLRETFVAYHNTRVVNCTAAALGHPDPTTDDDVWKVCFRWVPQSPENYLNTLAAAATVFSLVIGAIVSGVGNALHARPPAQAERCERVMIVGGTVVMWLAIPVVLFKGLFESPLGYVVVEALGADFIVVAKLHRTWRREVLRDVERRRKDRRHRATADDATATTVVVAHRPEPQI